MRNAFLLLVLPCLAIAVQQVRAQDNQYWTLQQGARATLMGGAATASTDDQSVLFYNPAAARKAKSTGVTASGSFLYGQRYKAKDLSGLGIEARDKQTDMAPRLLVGSFDPRKDGRWRVSFGFVCAQYARFEISQAATFDVERDAQQPGTELITSLVNTITTTRDDLMGLGGSYAVGKKGALGFSLFGSSFVQRYLHTVDLGMYGDPAVYDTVPTLAGILNTERADIYNIGLLAKLGYLHAGERTQWGLTLTLPRLSTDLSKGTLYRATSITRADGSVEKHLLSGTELSTRYNTPWTVDAGIETHTGTTIWALRVAYAAAVDAYDRLALLAPEDLTQGALPPVDGTLRRVRSASVPVINGAIGAQFRLNDAADLLAGVRTDFNHLDRSQLDPATDVSGTFSYWDIYHFSCGVAVHSARVKLTTGLVYAFGTDTGTPYDLAQAGDFISGGEPVPFKTTFNQLGIIFGFSYFALSKEEKAPPATP